MKDFLNTLALIFAGFVIGALSAFFAVSAVTRPAEPESIGPLAPDTVKTAGPSITVRKDTVWLPTVPVPIKIPASVSLSANSADVPQNPPADSTVFQHPGDSALVAIPIVEQTFEGDWYRAVVQGYQPVLKSIEIRHPETPQPKRKWWAVSVGPQVGYGFTPTGWQPYAGVGVTVGIIF